MEKKRIAVVGIGGVGGYLAGLLCRTFPYVTLVARGERKEKIRKNGIVLHSEYKGELAGIPDQVCEAAELEEQDVIFLCVKNYSLEQACNEIAHAVSSDTIVVPVMNGIDPGERTRKYLGKGTVIDALIYIVSFANPDFSITQQGKFADLYLGTAKGGEQERKKAELTWSILEKAGVDAHLSEDIECAIWKKYMLNCAYNVATAYYNEPIGKLRADVEKAKEYEALVWEAYEVARAAGIGLTKEDAQITIHKFYHGYGEDATSSLMRDCAAGRKSEVDTFSGYLVREAHRLGIAVPVSEKMYQGLITKCKGV